FTSPQTFLLRGFVLFFFGPCWYCHQQAAPGLIEVHKIACGFVGDNTNKGEILEDIVMLTH
ncbi:MAG TPA: hypothetical protein VGN20_08730, partial [Mucilaginibacter sp.]